MAALLQPERKDVIDLCRAIPVQIHFQECDILCMIFDAFGLEEKP